MHINMMSTLDVQTVHHVTDVVFDVLIYLVTALSIIWCAAYLWVHALIRRAQIQARRNPSRLMNLMRTFYGSNFFDDDFRRALYNEIDEEAPGMTDILRANPFALRPSDKMARHVHTWLVTCDECGEESWATNEGYEIIHHPNCSIGNDSYGEVESDAAPYPVTCERCEKTITSGNRDANRAMHAECASEADDEVDDAVRRGIIERALSTNDDDTLALALVGSYPDHDRFRLAAYEYLSTRTEASRDSLTDAAFVVNLEPIARVLTEPQPQRHHLLIAQVIHRAFELRRENLSQFDTLTSLNLPKELP